MSKKVMEDQLQVAEVSSTVSSGVKEPKYIDLAFIDSHQPRSYCLFRSSTAWYENKFKNDPTKYNEVPNSVASRLQVFAETLMQEEVAAYKKSSSSSNSPWISTVLSAGTGMDKIAALVSLVKESPVHNLTALKSLVGRVTVKSRRDCMNVLRPLRELFLESLLVPHRKLQYFNDHPFFHLSLLSGENRDDRDCRLLVWYFEDQIKKYYGIFLEGLLEVASDQISETKIKALTLMSNLLSENPEQEKTLLTMIINKLGDPDKKIGSHVLARMRMLLNNHPNMSITVVSYLEHFLYRPNIGERVQYYVLCFLSQTIFTHDDPDLPEMLVDAYFKFFKSCTQKGEVNTRLMSVLLTGVRRAYPYLSQKTKNSGSLSVHRDTIYKMIPLVTFNIEIQALSLLQMISGQHDQSQDRFYCVLYRKLLHPSLTLSSQKMLFLSLVYKSMRNDPSLNRLKAFTRRLLQICKYQPASMVCGILLLISEVVRVRPGVLSVTPKPPTSHQEEKTNDNVIVLFHSEEEKKKGTKQEHASNDETRHTEYSPHLRNPKFCGAEFDIMWELDHLSQHFHPSVAHFATRLLNGQPINYTGDPLNDFSLLEFLNKFVFKNPKIRPAKEAMATVFSKRSMYVPSGLRAMPVNSESFLNTNEKIIPLDELFFYKYYSQKRFANKKSEEEEEDWEHGSVDSDDAEEYLSRLGYGVPHEGVDLAGEIAEGKKKKKKTSIVRPTSPESDSEEEETDLEDDAEFEEMFRNFDDILEHGDAGDDFEVASVESEEEYEQQKNTVDKRKSNKKMSEKEKSTKLHPKKRKRFDESKLLVSAEEVSSMLESNIGRTSGRSDALSNLDQASEKQFTWERSRQFPKKQKNMDLQHHNKKQKSWKNRRDYGGRSHSKNKTSRKPFKNVKQHK